MGRLDAGRFTRHKIRGEWFQDRTSYPRRDVYPAALSAPRPAGGPTWEEAGPHDIGGRLTSVAVHPNNPDCVYVGAAGGGVWSSVDAGRTWVQSWSDQSPTLAIGSLALDPSNPDVLYCGTGEANQSGDDYAGVGVFRNRGDRAGWQLIGDSNNRIVDIGGGKMIVAGLPRRIGALAVDPFDSKHILAGGISFGGAQVAALFASRDGGQNWERVGDANSKAVFGDRNVFISGYNYWCNAVVFHPDVKGLLYATIEARGTQSGIWISHDGGASWTHAVQGLPEGDKFGRTSLAVAPGSKRVYALAGDPTTHQLVGLFRSDDLGLTWQAHFPESIKQDGQLHYTNCLAVHPQHPNFVVAGSVDLHISRDGGRTFRRSSQSTYSFDSPHYAHGDHHAITFAGDRIYSANDGGLAVSDDGGHSWQMRTTGLAVSMFYSMDVAPTNTQCVGGGLQDNGTWCSGPLTTAQKQSKAEFPFRHQLDGDGGWLIYDPDDETHIFASAQRIQLFRHVEGKRWKELRTKIPKEDRKLVFMAILAMDESSNARKPRALYLGSNRIWKSTDGGDTWRAVSNVFDGSVITAIEVASANPEHVYVGTTNGSFFRSKDAGQTWSNNLAGPHTPGRTITRIETEQGDARRVYFTVGVVAEQVLFGEDVSASSVLATGGAPIVVDGKAGLIEFRHLYFSPDGGDTWDDADQGGLPNLPHQAVVAAYGDPPWICVAHDAGVMMRRFSPQATGWLNITGNLPNVRVTDLVYHWNAGYLYASTYGRGIWRVPITALTQFAGK